MRSSTNSGVRNDWYRRVERNDLLLRLRCRVEESVDRIDVVEHDLHSGCSRETLHRSWKGPANVTTRVHKVIVIGALASIVSVATAALIAQTGGHTSPKVAAPPKDDSPPVPSMAVIVRDASPAAKRTTRPARPRENMIQLPDGQMAVQNPDGTLTVDTTLLEPEESTIEGAISIRQMMRDHGREVRILQSGIGSSRHERDTCLLEFAQRGGTIKKQYEWSIGLTFTGDGKEVRVGKVQALRDRWPDEFDEKAKDCYLESFARERFASTERLDMTVEFPLCVYPPTSANGGKRRSRLLAARSHRRGSTRIPDRDQSRHEPGHDSTSAR